MGLWISPQFDARSIRSPAFRHTDPLLANVPWILRGANPLRIGRPVETAGIKSKGFYYFFQT